MKTKEVYLSTYCKTCTHCQGKYCCVFKRPVDLKFNRCWLHSNYQPYAKEFQVRKNLEEIILMEEAIRKADEIKINKELQEI